MTLALATSTPPSAVVGLGGAGMHCALERLRDQQHPCAWTGEPALHRKPPASRADLGRYLFGRLAYIGSTFLGVGACDNLGAVQDQHSGNHMQKENVNGV